jgi:hypothetical protein
MDNIKEPFAPNQIIRFKAQIKDGVIVLAEGITLPADQTYVVTLQPIAETDPSTPLDALAEIAALAQPLGPADLSANFDIYTGRVLSDDLIP